MYKYEGMDNCMKCGAPKGKLLGCTICEEIFELKENLYAHARYETRYLQKIQQLEEKISRLEKKVAILENYHQQIIDNSRHPAWSPSALRWLAEKAIKESKEIG
jgi:hypothetical protein